MLMCRSSLPLTRRSPEGLNATVLTQPSWLASFRSSRRRCTRLKLLPACCWNATGLFAPSLLPACRSSKPRNTDVMCVKGKLNSEPMQNAGYNLLCRSRSRICEQQQPRHRRAREVLTYKRWLRSLSRNTLKSRPALLSLRKDINIRHQHRTHVFQPGQTDCRHGEIVTYCVL